MRRVRQSVGVALVLDQRCVFLRFAELPARALPIRMTKDTGNVSEGGKFTGRRSLGRS